jgi:hypothetical protein
MGGTLDPFSGDANWLFHNNLFDQTLLSNWGFTNHHYNAYFNELNWDDFEPLNASEIVLTNLAYQTGPQGRFYVSTNSPLINSGSTSATNVGLYHFATTTNQVKETNSIVDIGAHYVAADVSGTPLDYDGDGVPDYFEDSSGNGSVDSGETDWLSPTDLGLRIFITRPARGSTLP